jgi:hypothetical protein
VSRRFYCAHGLMYLTWIFAMSGTFFMGLS